MSPPEEPSQSAIAPRGQASGKWLKFQVLTGTERKLPWWPKPSSERLAGKAGPHSSRKGAPGTPANSTPQQAPGPKHSANKRVTLSSAVPQGLRPRTSLAEAPVRLAPSGALVLGLREASGDRTSQCVTSCPGGTKRVPVISQERLWELCRGPRPAPRPFPQHVSLCPVCTDHGHGDHHC